MCKHCYDENRPKKEKQKKYFPGTCVKCGASPVFRKQLSMCELCYYRYDYARHPERGVESTLKCTAKRKALGIPCIECGKPEAVTKSMCVVMVILTPERLNHLLGRFRNVLSKP